MYLLLSPAKNLNEKSKIPFDITHKTTLPPLLEQSNTLMNALKQLDVTDIQELMEVSTKISELNVKRNLEWHADYQDDKNAKAALYLFDGDAYKGLDAYELNETEVDYLNKRLGILSGLYGLLKPLDLMLPYRLEMGIKLKTTQHNDLYEFWGNKITELLIGRMNDINSQTLINVASNEYFSAVNTQLLKEKGIDIITPRFEDEKDGNYKVISFYAKRARGLMTRFCAVNNITTADDLKDFNMEGYYFCPDLSDNQGNWVFRRNALDR